MTNGVIDFGAAMNNNQAAGKEQPKARWYLNIGAPNNYMGADGEEKEGRICLPYGLAIDTMPYMKGNSQMAKDYNAMLDLIKSAIFEPMERQLKEAGENGGTKPVSGLGLFATIAADPEVNRQDNQKDLASKLNLSFG